MDIEALIEGYSKAMYSTWLYYKPDRLLLDVGEGAASQLGNRVFGVRRILLSHGHLDHLSGLLTLLHIRAAGMGDNESPLTIYYPEGDWYVSATQQHIAHCFPRLPFALTWTPVSPGDVIPVTDDEADSEQSPSPKVHSRCVEVFPTRHSQGRLTVGYHILEQRNRLKAEYRSLPPNEIARIARERGRQSFTETYERRLLSYSGDCTPLDAELVKGTQLLLHEATFVEEEDRNEYVHSSVDEAVQVAGRAEVGALVLLHLSSRYRREEMLQRITESCQRYLDPSLPVWMLWNKHLVRIQPQEPSPSSRPSKRRKGRSDKS